MPSKNLNKEKIKAISGKIICLKDKAAQQRAFISLLAVSAFSEYLEEIGLKVFAGNNLHSVCPVIEEFDMADIRTEENNVIIDIRAIWGNEYPQMCIPVEHFSKGIRPDIYVGIRISENLEKAEFVGCIQSDKVSLAKGTKNYFIVESEDLNSIEELENLAKTIKKTRKNYLAFDHEKAKNLFIPFIDGVISEDDKNYLIEHLTDCDDCRKAFINLFELDCTLKLFNKDSMLAGEEVSVETEEAPAELPEKLAFEETDEELAELSEEMVFEETEEAPAELPEKPAFEEADEELAELSEEMVFEETDEELAELSEKSIVEEAEEKPIKKKQRRHVDWADELVDDLTDNEEPVKKTQLSSEESLTLMESEEKLDESEIKAELKEDTLEISLSDQNIQEEFFLDENRIGSGIIEDAPEELIKSKLLAEKTKKTTEKTHQDEEIENILETLDDVEVINEEDAIDNLLSFIEHDQSHHLPPPPDPSPLAPTDQEQSRDNTPKLVVVEEEELPLESAPPEIKQLEEKQLEEEQQEDIIKEELGDYATVLDSSKNNIIEEPDILVYEEGRAPVEVISQEELMNIFDTRSAYEKNNKNKEEKKKFSIKTLFKDKNTAILTVAITLSTTVLFLSLGQINSQMKTTGVTNSEKNETANQENKQNAQKGLVRRQRKPLTSYTRELIKTVKYEKPAQIFDKKKLMNSVSAQKTIQKQSEPKKVEIKNISWELNASVAKNPKVKKYFLDIGYLLQDSLSKNLYMPDVEVKDAQIGIYAEFDSKRRILTKTVVYKGSGLDKIDNICLKELRQVVKNNKFPKVILDKNKIKLKLMIRI